MNPAPLHIRQDDLTDPRIAAFMEEHLADMRRVSPPEVNAYQTPGVTGAPLPPDWYRDA